MGSICDAGIDFRLVHARPILLRVSVSLINFLTGGIDSCEESTPWQNQFFLGNQCLEKDNQTVTIMF